MAQYKSVTKSHSIVMEISINTSEALVSQMRIQPHSPVDLVLMLRNMADELYESGIVQIVQQVTPSDWETVLEPIQMFEYVNTNHTHGYVNIRCATNKFPEAVMRALDYQPPQMN